MNANFNFVDTQTLLVGARNLQRSCHCVCQLFQWALISVLVTEMRVALLDRRFHRQ
jgi:hypothetical protein